MADGANSEPKPDPETKSVKPEGSVEALTIGVQTLNGEKVSFRVKPHTTMAKIFAAFTEKMGVAPDTYRFLLDGIRVRPENTPGELDLEDGDMIDAFVEQSGGVTGSGGRVRMPHNNRVSSSASMKMTDIWSKTIGYDPYAAEGETAAASEGQQESMERAKGIMALAKINNAEHGNTGEKSTNFARQVFWGLKRRAPPKGYEVPVLSDDSSGSDDSSDDSSDDDAARAAAAARDVSQPKLKGGDRSRSPSSEREAKRRRRDYDSEDSKSPKERKVKKEKRSKKEKKEKKEKKGKKGKKEKKSKKNKKKNSKGRSRADSD